MTARRVTLEALIKRTEALPPMPQVAQRALTLIRNPDSSMAELAEVVALDQAMASLVLRWVNSPYYGLLQPVATVRQAVVYLGQNTVQSLVLAASVTAFMERPAPGYGLERGDLWKHSVGVAACARLVAAKFGSQVAEEAYYAGLLCDIGKLAFEVLLRDVDTMRPEWQGRTFSELEQLHFGIDHAALGAEMARRWNLPERIVEAIACHHHPAGADEGAILAAAVHIADAVITCLGVGIGRDGLQYALDPVACERLDWTEAELRDLLDRVGPLLKEAENFLQPGKN